MSCIIEVSGFEIDLGGSNVMVYEGKREIMDSKNLKIFWMNKSLEWKGQDRTESGVFGVF
jgi:hypothetical protein